jgi:hypothetical protein
MKFSYRMNQRELAKALSMLGTPVVGAWLVYLVVAVAMFPSIVLFVAIGAEISFGWFGWMAISILLASGWAFYKRTGYPIPFSESMEFTEDQVTYCFGNSRVECRWSVIDTIEDSEGYLVISCHGRPWLLPKRVLGERQRQCVDFLQRAVAGGKDPSPLPPVSIYQELILAGPGPGYRYQVTSEDLAQAARDKFQHLDLNQASGKLKSAFKLGWLGLSLLSIVLLLLLFQTTYFSFEADPVLRSTSIVTWGLTGLGWLLPIIWLMIWRKWSWWFRVRAIRQKLPRLESTLKLNFGSWVIANALGGTVGDWRDLRGIIFSDRFFGFKMVNQLTYLIPRRIFPSPEEANEFLKQVLEHYQNASRSQPDPSSFPGLQVYETNNPYQSPAS